jgi:hypothetical protein
MLLRLVSLVLMALFIIACGGGGGSSLDIAADTGTVSVFITDDLTQDFEKAWITIQRVVIADSGGTEYTLYEDNQGRVFNLLELSGVGALLNTSTLPAGTYIRVRITVANEITLVDRAGQTTIARFSPSGTQYTIQANGNLSVMQGQSTAFGLDFDTKQFTYDPQTNLVTSVVIFKAEEELNSLTAMYAKVKGYVTEVVNSSKFKIQLKNSGAVVTATLHASGVVFDENTGATATDTSLLRSGQEVEVYGDYDPASLTIVAISVKIEKSSRTGQAEAKGVVTAINGTTLTLDVREAEYFVPPSGSITVDISQAIFSKGSLSMLAVGQWIEVKGSWDGSVFTAGVVEIEGAPAGGGNQNGNRNGNTNGNQNGNWNGNQNGGSSYVEIKGSIQSISGNIITVNVYEYEHFIPPSNLVDADVTNAWYKHGTAANLAPGVWVEVKGSWNGSMIIATVVEFEH